MSGRHIGKNVHFQFLDSQMHFPLILAGWLTRAFVLLSGILFNRSNDLMVECLTEGLMNEKK